MNDVLPVTLQLRAEIATAIGVLLTAPVTTIFLTRATGRR